MTTPKSQTLKLLNLGPKQQTTKTKKKMYYFHNHTTTYTLLVELNGEIVVNLALIKRFFFFSKGNILLKN